MGCHTFFYEKVKNVPSDDIMLKYSNKITYETIKSDGTKRKDGYYDLKFDLYKSWMKITHYKERPEMTSEILDINNGERFQTYALKGERGSKCFCLNGAAARKVQIGDKIIIVTYAQLTSEEIPLHKPTVVQVDDNNNIVRQ